MLFLKLFLESSIWKSSPFHSHAQNLLKIQDLLKFFYKSIKQLKQGSLQN